MTVASMVAFLDSQKEDSSVVFRILICLQNVYSIATYIVWGLHAVTLTRTQQRLFGGIGEEEEEGREIEDSDSNS